MRKALRCTPIVTIWSILLIQNLADPLLLVHKLRKWSHSFETPFIMCGDVFCHFNEFTHSLLLHSLETSLLGWNEEHRKYSCFLLYAQQTVHANCLFFFLALSYGGGGAAKVGCILMVYNRACFPEFCFSWTENLLYVLSFKV